MLVFVVLYKLCDALAGTMTAPFVLSLGYDKGTYAAIVKGVGLAALLIGGFAGGAVAARHAAGRGAVARAPSCRWSPTWPSCGSTSSRSARGR